MISGSTASTSPAASRLFHWIDIVHAPPFVSSVISIGRMLLHNKYLWIMNKELGMNVAASPRSMAQVAAVLAFVISHTTFLAAQDDETGRCPKDRG